jgi:hypothetical protein
LKELAASTPTTFFEWRCGISFHWASRRYAPRGWCRWNWLKV